MHSPIFSNREGVSQINEGQVYFNYNNFSAVFSTTVHPVIEHVYTRSNFDRPEPYHHPLCLTRTLALAALEISGNKQYSEKGLSDHS